VGLQLKEVSPNVAEALLEVMASERVQEALDRPELIHSVA
jgi:hypothetical protein